MAGDTGNSLRIDMKIMLAGQEAVIFGTPKSVTRRALVRQVDLSRIPYRSRLAAVAADIRTRAVRIIHGRSASCAVYVAQ